MTLYDTATEFMLQLFTRVPDENLTVVAKNVNWEALTQLKEQSGMSDAEWDYVVEAQERTEKALKLEDTHAFAHELALCEQFKHQTLGDKPLLVFRFNMVSDYRQMYVEGARLGDGSEEEREKAKKFILLCNLYDDRIAWAQCKLSGDVVHKAFCERGHDITIRKPAFVAEKIRRYLERSAGK